VQAERDDRRGVRMPEYAEHPALFVRTVIRAIEGERLGLGSNRYLA
jgi:hypothetical protein